MTQNKSSKAPEHEVRVGNVRGAVWFNETAREGRTVVQASVKIENNYRDKNGVWQTSSRFFTNDLPRLTLVATKIYEFIMLKENSNDTFPPAGDQPEE